MSFFSAWLTGELVVLVLFWQIVFTALFAWLGAFDSWPGWLGLAITVVSWCGLVWVIVVSQAVFLSIAVDAYQAALKEQK